MGGRQLSLLPDGVRTSSAPLPRGGTGEVFTRRWIVEFILDVSGYTPDKDLVACVALEPACGGGAFLGPMVARLMESARRHGRSPEEARPSIQAFDLSPSNVQTARRAVTASLVAGGITAQVADALAATWVTHDDFLLLDGQKDVADFVVGNPPYIRLEDVPKSRSDSYRRACPTMRGRSDVYVGFIEKGLTILKPGGVLGFIVADRWMHNQYGSALRALVAKEFCVEAVVEMHQVDAFEETVSAYPAVTVIRRRQQGSAVLATTTGRFAAPAARELKAWMARPSGRTQESASFTAARLPSWFPGKDLWPSGDPASLALVADIEKRCPPLQDSQSQTRVGIGVATGADAVYLTRDRTLVEEDRLLPLAAAVDTASGRLAWSGTYLVNPWRNGALVDLEAYPKLAAYMNRHESVVRRRHVARRQPHAWYRTIDRIDPTLQSRPKLLLPDMKASIHPVLEDGQLYPHHNLYFVVSDRWDIEALGGLLLSDIANLFVGTYCVKMRGGCYRFQAQYLRRIRVPAHDSIRPADMRALATAFRQLDREAATAVARRLYGLDPMPATARMS
jgi:hypothetical protein